ncbi:MAG: aryl-sulfate sulfotransferase, partial [Flavobacteriales bacterium]|nr:aryl-sulfate sulfotransferase [Flavobacteriales bacterium]
MKRNLLAFAALLLVIPSIASTCFNDGTLCLQFVSPKPESIYHRPETRIVIRHGEVLDISALQLNPGLLSITGSISGNHVCTYWLASDQKTLQIVPQTPFEYGETVSVEISGLRLVSGNVLLPEFGYSFSTMNAPPATLSADVAHNDELEAESGDRDFPSVTTLTLNNPAPGNIFMGITGLQKFISILDNEGNDPPLWFQETNGDGNDFKIQESGYLTYFARTPQFWYVMNDEIEIVDTLHMLNGYLCDDHECLYLADGHYFLQCYDHQTMDLSGEVPGGNVAADVIGYIWQEIDANEDLLMEWRSWDYLDMFESYHVSWTSDQLDLWHGNSIERDADMNILVSLRNTDEILKINGATGEIIWRFGGGLYNQFDLLGGAGFTYQHDARVLPNGHITVYNNGN